MGQIDQAVAVFKRAVELSPYAGHEKYMYLSQLVDGPESLEYSSRGIELLKRACACEEEDAQYAEDLRGQLCQAICSTVETMLNIPEFLSSSSHPGRAEDAARMLEEAQASSPQSPEPAQVKASLLVEVGGREEEARAALRHSMSLWYVRPESLCGGDQDEQGGGMEVDGRDGTGAESHLREGCAPPSFEFRFETAKLIMELEDDARDSLAILEGLLDENDASLDTWFLLTLAHQGMGQIEEAKACLDHIEQAISAYPADAEERESIRLLRLDAEKIAKELAEEEEKRRRGV